MSSVIFVSHPFDKAGDPLLPALMMDPENVKEIMAWYDGGDLACLPAVVQSPPGVSYQLPDFPFGSGIAPPCLSNRALQFLGLGKAQSVPLQLDGRLVDWSFVNLPCADSHLDLDRTVKTTRGQVQSPVFSSLDSGTMFALSNPWLHGGLTYYVHSETWADMCRLGLTGLVEIGRQEL